MKLKNLFNVGLFALAVISCSKDDGPDISNNNTPVITDPKTFNVPENIDDVYVIGTIKATDADEEDTLEFSISGNSDALFEITKAGALSLANGKSLDFATKSQHIISVSVSDGKDSAKANITINVTEFDENNGAPSFNEASYAYQVDENIGSGVVFGTLTADDPESDPLEFLITENDNELFAITPQGSLSVAEGKNLDFETSEQHIITVGVTDDNTITTIQVTINVTDDGKLSDNPDSFVMVWSVEDQNKQIEVALNPDYNTYDFVVDWGDGIIEEKKSNVNLNMKHVYANPGTYTVSILGTFPAIQMQNSPFPEKLVSLKQWGSTIWKTMERAFQNCSNMIYEATDLPNLSEVQDYDFMFQGASSFNANLNGWVVDNATSMTGMFVNASSFNSDLDQWNVGNVTDMRFMFSNATAFNGDISNWNVVKVEKMVNMFLNATAFNGNISGWTTSELTSIEGIFKGAIVFNQDLDTWDTSKVTNMESAFEGAIAFNGNIGTWNTSNVENMKNMFKRAESFDQDLNSNGNIWNTQNVTNMEGVFDRAISFNGNISDWNTGNVTTMNKMFLGNEDDDSAFNGDISGWDVGKVEDYGNMFAFATTFNQNISGWNTGLGHNMSSMFEGASAFSQNLGDWPIGSVQSMNGMFDLSGMSTQNYSNTLIGWSQQNVNLFVELGAEGLNYCNNAQVTDARQTLEVTNSWNIVGDGDGVNCF